MRHFIYSVHACSSSRWAKGYTEFYMTDIENPSRNNPVMSAVVLQVGETEEVFDKEKELYHPSTEILVKIFRATYNSKEVGYSIKEQKGYLFSIRKNHISAFLYDCECDIDLVLKMYQSMDINDPKFVNWNYQVSKG